MRLENLSASPFAGWKRCTVDAKPPYEAGEIESPDGSDVLPVLYVVGRQVGLDTRVVDLRVMLRAGERRSIDLAKSRPAKWTRPPLPANPEQTFGGPASIAGAPLVPVGGVVGDGAGYAVQCRARVGSMLVSDLWLLWYPDQPAWCIGELAVTASNPNVPDLSATVPGAFELRFGDALVTVPGRVPLPGALIAAGVQFADGQARAMPVTFVWARNARSVADFASIMAIAPLGPDGKVLPTGISAIGIAQLLADGNPRLPPGFDARGWTAPKFAAAAAKLHSWEPALLGPNPTSGDTGEQEDEVFVRGECMPVGGGGAEIVAYLSALKMANRPCHHLEQDGQLLDLARPRSKPLIFWDGRPHSGLWNVCDRLGKPTPIGPVDASGWWGPDVEHALFNTLDAGARLTGSWALQRELAAIARVYLCQWTVQAGWSTTQPYAARARGWEGFLVVHLWRDLEDRPLASAVKARALARFDAFKGWYQQAERNLLDIRTNDPRLGPGERWIPWQVSVEAAGYDVMGRVFARPDISAIALQVAKVVLRDAYVQSASGWTTRDVVAMDGAQVTTGFFDLFGMPLAAPVVLRYEPNNEQARSIWQQDVQRSTLPKHTHWLAPGVQ